MPSSLQDYLAKNYLSKKEQKKLAKEQKKKKKEEKEEGKTKALENDGSQNVVQQQQQQKPIQEQQEDLKDAVIVSEEDRKIHVAQTEVPDGPSKIKEIEDPMSVFTTNALNTTQKNPLQTSQSPAAYSENRYKIKAGKLWDGINRSNGFEQKVLNKIKQKELSKYSKDYYDDDIIDHYSD